MKRSKHQIGGRRLPIKLHQNVVDGFPKTDEGSRVCGRTSTNSNITNKQLEMTNWNHEKRKLDSLCRRAGETLKGGVVSDAEVVSESDGRWSFFLQDASPCGRRCLVAGSLTVLSGLSCSSVRPPCCGPAGDLGGGERLLSFTCRQSRRRFVQPQDKSHPDGHILQITCHCYSKVIFCSLKLLSLSCNALHYSCTTLEYCLYNACRSRTQHFKVKMD